MFTRFLFKPHESTKVILAILLSVIIITSFSSCAIKNNSEQNHLVYYTLNDEDSLSWIIEKYNKYTFKIFGSRARGDYKKESDIDLAIMDDVDAKTKFNIMNDFDMIEIPYQIDLVFVIDVQKKEFLNSIERDGVVFDE